MTIRLFKVRRQTTVQAATARARRLYPKSKGFQTVYLKGWRARRAKLPASACPYDRKLTGPAGNATWTYAWRTVWMTGWQEGA